MKTEKLYDLDSHLNKFTAVVLECKPYHNGWSVVLNRTAFFPEGGGQASDIGTIDNANVSDVQIKENIIYHFTDLPLEEGSTVTGVLDYKRRYSFMQNHSGEHIVSGIINRLYGFDNVGFSLGEQFVTLDFNGILTRDDLDKIELIANEKIWNNVKFKTWYPKSEELKNISFRSKKEIDGEIRIVEIEDTDICACCAPHVKEASEIGIIKLLDFERLRGGVRIYMKCGKYALEDYRVKYLNVQQIGSMLSVKQENCASAVQALSDKLNAQKQNAASLKKRIIDQIVRFSDSSQKVIFEDGLDIKELQLLADGLARKFGGIRAAFSKKEDESFAFAICGEPKELDAFFVEFKNKLPVRGGGRCGIVQGSVNANMEEIKLCF